MQQQKRATRARLGRARRATKIRSLHDEMVSALERFLGIRKPNVPWTRAQAERSLKALEREVQGLLSRAGAR